jgi:3,4-dihydroxy-2-butanone 4-phosphate synthase
MRRDGLFEFARQHQLPIITIQQLIDHRKKMQ